jgi:hypothetical protein
MDHGKIGFAGVYRIYVTHDNDQGRALVNTVTSLLVA